MNPIPLSSLPDVDGAQVMCVVATLKSIDMYRCSSPDAPEKDKWSYQDGVLSADGYETTVCFAARGEVPATFVGKTLRFECTQNQRGWAGVKMKKRQNYKTKKDEVILWITGTANIKIESGSNSAPQQNRQNNQPPQHQNRPSNPPPRNQQPSRPAQTPEEAVAAAKKSLTRIGFLYQLCLAEANVQKRVYEETLGYTMADDQFQAMTSAFFITAERQMLSTNLPLDSIEQYLDIPQDKANPVD